MLAVEYERRRNFQSYASDVVKLHFAGDVTEFNKGSTMSYKPDMVYQIFGYNELIYGYRDLQINIYFCTTTGHSLVDIIYSEKAPTDERRGLSPDNLKNTLKSWFPMGFSINKEEYFSMQMPTHTQPFGRCIAKFSYPVSNGARATYMINMCDISEAGFKEFHKRIEPILIFYIEGANFIDLDDDRWTVLYMYEEKSSPNGFVYSIVGFCTLYSFYKNPYNNRVRISQILILPTYQRLGLGTRLLTTIYQLINQEMPTLWELTVESPNSNFSKVRAMLDCKLLMELPSFSRENVRAGLSKQMIQDARHRAKINSRQCDKIYNILRMMYTDLEDEQDVQLLKMEIKRRLYREVKTQFYRSVWRGADLEKIEKYELLLNIPTFSEEYLERQFVSFFRLTKPLIDQLKHYPYVQPRKPMQLVLQKY